MVRCGTCCSPWFDDVYRAVLHTTHVPATAITYILLRTYHTPLTNTPHWCLKHLHKHTVACISVNLFTPPPPPLPRIPCTLPRVVVPLHISYLGPDTVGRWVRNMCCFAAFRHSPPPPRAYRSHTTTTHRLPAPPCIPGRYGLVPDGTSACCRCAFAWFMDVAFAGWRCSSQSSSVNWTPVVPIFLPSTNAWNLVSLAFLHPYHCWYYFVSTYLHIVPMRLVGCWRITTCIAIVHAYLA